MSNRNRKTKKELNEILQSAGLVLAEPFDPSKQYPPDREFLAECSRCHAQAHYSLRFIQGRKRMGQTVCQACYWDAEYNSLMKRIRKATDGMCEIYRKEQADKFARMGDETQLKRLLETSDDDVMQEVLNQAIIDGDESKVSLIEFVLNDHAKANVEAARQIAESHGFVLLDLMNVDKSWKLLYVVKCRYCGRQSVMRREDIEKGCSCEGSDAAEPQDAADDDYATGNGSEANSSSPEDGTAVPDA